MRISHADLEVFSRAPEAIERHFQAYGLEDSKPKANTYMLGHSGTEKLSVVLDQLIASQLTRPALTPLRKYEETAKTKWWGPQGKVASLTNINQKYDEYYRHDPDVLIGDVSDGVRYLVDQIYLAYPELRDHPLRVWTPEQSVENTVIVRRSLSGVLAMGDRRDPVIQAHSINWLKTRWFQLLPVIGGQRFQKNKLRAIFMDEFANLLSVQRVVRPAHNILAAVPGFTMWTGVAAMERKAADWLKTDASYFESDYKSMDMYYRAPLAHATVGKVYRAIYDKRDWWMIDLYIDSIFNVPLIDAADSVRFGKHAMFSGLEPTNDWESISSFCINAQTLHDTYEAPIRGNLYGKSLLERAEIEVVGDDTVVRLANLRITTETRFSTRYGTHTLPDMFCIVGGFAGLVAERLKQYLQFNEFKYCKRWYSRSCKMYRTESGVLGLLSIYPLRLMLNSIAYPEWGFLEDPKQETLRILSIMDNAFGHPLWATFLQRVASEMRGRLELKLSQSDVDEYNALHRKEWKDLVTGFKYHLESSPAYVWLTQQRILDAAPFRLRTSEHD